MCNSPCNISGCNHPEPYPSSCSRPQFLFTTKHETGKGTHCAHCAAAAAALAGGLAQGGRRADHRGRWGRGEPRDGRGRARQLALLILHLRRLLRIQELPPQVLVPGARANSSWTYSRAHPCQPVWMGSTTFFL